MNTILLTFVLLSSQMPGDCDPGCDVNAVCNVDDECVCNPGYSGDGLSCVDIGICDQGLDDCDVNATCTNTPGSFQCSCNSGYTGDGNMCENIDECALGTDNCDPNATCADMEGFFTCTCDNGYAGNGVTCIDIDECAEGTDNCPAFAPCVNTLGSFSCSCPSGTVGDGVNICDDINECALETDNCDTNASCTNIYSSFTCACNLGYSGDGVTCSEIDECAEGTDGCAADATCMNTAGSFLCECNDGFIGDGFICDLDIGGCPAGTIETGPGICEDIDECADGTDGCDENATCANTYAAFICECNIGYGGDGVSCELCPDGYTGTACSTDIDECTEATDACPDEAPCMNLPGSYSCDCGANTTWNGEECVEEVLCPAEELDCDLLSPCDENASCSIVTDVGTQCDAYECVCAPGYMGDGFDCELSTEDPCVTCDENATCNFPSASPDADSVCTCNDGYVGPGEICVSIEDACGACDENATCDTSYAGEIDGVGLCTCNDGYEGDGTVCAPVDGATDGGVSDGGTTEDDDPTEDVDTDADADADDINIIDPLACSSCASQSAADVGLFGVIGFVLMGRRRRS